MSSYQYSDAIRLQNELAKLVVAEDCFSGEIENICGIDVSYRKHRAYCSAVVTNKKTLESIESVDSKSIIKHQYIAGLLMLRESQPIITTLKMIRSNFELLLVDGHGMLHPRKCGLASYIGVITDKPTIGIAKHLLCGCLRQDQFVELDGEILGFRIDNERPKKSYYVSVGHKISLHSAILIVKKTIKTGEWAPEPLRIADQRSKNLAELD
jgi:deoxyribonuclease V